MISNAIINGSGAYKVLSRFPSPSVVIALPLRENPGLDNMALVEMCLTEIRLTYPRIREFVVSIEPTRDFGPTLQIIVR
jgi:hypothetical protein